MAKRKNTEKKKIALKSEKINVKDPNNEVETQFFWLVGIIIVIILGFVFVPILYHQIFEKFEYGGVKFEKIKEGQLTFYHGQFPIVYKGNFSAVYNVYFRNDPRKNKIPINITLGISKKITVSLNNDAHLCEDMILGQSELGKFFGSFPFVKNVSTGIYSASVAKELDMPQITCENASIDSTVIVIQKSETPSIEMGNRENCYILNIGKCEYLETVERFVVGAMAQVNEKPLE